MLTLSRPNYLAEKIVFLDGLTGTGKTLMAPLLSSLQRVELSKFDHIYEFLGALNSMEKIDSDAAEYLISMYADFALYNIMISREINFRFNDLSSVFRNCGTWRYLRRLWYKDGVAVEARIKKEKPILQIIAHQALPIMDSTFRALKGRLRVIEMVRHPLYLIEHWNTYIERYGCDPRDFTIWIDYNGKTLPWFARGWEELYSVFSPMDKVIYTIQWLTNQAEEMVSRLEVTQQKQILFIPFEHFVLKPFPFLRQIEELLETKMTSATKRVLRQQKCPRKQITAGPAKAIYKRYGWTEPDPRSTTLTDLQKKRAIAQSLATPAALEVLDKISREYEKKYGLWF
ncbi:MAG: hypothetical protein Q8M83_01570 [bacterium]|nr:hypothetical protein [bacterium]